MYEMHGNRQGICHMPELSVLMGIYNEKKIQAARAIDSILGQTFTDFELIICDDGSEKAFYQWLQGFCKKDARIRLVRNGQNRGLAAALNRCLSLASGRFLARMDADDISVPERFEKQLAFLKEHPAYAFAAGNAYLTDENGVWGLRKMAEAPQKEDFLHTSPFIHPTVMFRREALLRAGGYCESEKVLRVEDYELFMRLYAAGCRGYNIQEPLLEYREDRSAYGRRRYRYRLHECMVRRKGFLQLGILRGNEVYVVKPLAAGMVPGCMVRKLHRRRYGIQDRSDLKCLQAGGENRTICIYVAHSPDSRQARCRHPLFYHVAAGSVLWKQPVPKGMLKDHTGINISGKNRSYCELTVQYWAWKNENADMYGFCHYRRYFSFASENLPGADCGPAVFPYMERGLLRRVCCPDERAIREKAGQYDFLIAKGIPVRPWAKNVYENFKKAPHLHGEDLDLFLKILCRRYPKLRKAVKTYMAGSMFYPFNMFLMKRELFGEYCTMLFAALEEFEQYTDMSLYSREALRTPGHLGERFAGIYYTYLQQMGGYRLGELQTVLFEQTGRQPEPGSKNPRQVLSVQKQEGMHQKTLEQEGMHQKTLEQEGMHQKTPEQKQEGIYQTRMEHKQKNLQEVLVVLAADRFYAPILFVCLKSLCSYTSPDRKYRICILHTDMDQAAVQQFVQGLSAGHIRIDFWNVGAKIAGYHLKGKGSITAETYYRFLIPKLFRRYPKAVYLDADTLVCVDIARLYDVQLGDCLLAAAPDVDVIGQYNGANPDTRYYQENTLRLEDPYSYIQAGVLVMNIPQLNKEISVRQLLTMAQQRDYRYSDQDIFNIVCQGRIRRLDLSWNVLMDCGPKRSEVIRHVPADLLEAYERARKSPCIIHYCGSPKPWEDPGGDFAEQFWETARQTPYYEVLLRRMTDQKRKPSCKTAAVTVLRYTAKKILPQGSFLRRMVGMLYWKLK